jgi:hypothetical protein
MGLLAADGSGWDRGIRRATNLSFLATWAVLAVTVVFATPLLAADGAAVVHASPTASTIVIGFVGGFVRHDNPHHGPVLFAERLQRIAPKNAYIRVFENRRRKAAYQTILHLLDRNGDGILSAEERAQARIILYGESWGGAATVLLARELNRMKIPVMLTVQVDSVAKLWERDGIVPANVAAAVNFYQPNGIIHGRAKIEAADPSRTQVLGNYRSDYKVTPVKCEGYSWADRTFTPGHMQAECDPHVWAQVEDLMRPRLETPSAVAENPGQ